VNQGIRVVFSTSVFEGAATGPSTYAQALWQAFSNDEEIDFHLVAPFVPNGHPRLHASGPGGGSSLGLYRALASKTLSIARSKQGTIIHANAAHSAYYFRAYPGPWIVQVNDYEVATIWQRPIGIVASSGAHRMGSLVWRHWQERRVVRLATGVVCNSEFTRGAVNAAYHTDKSKTTVVYPTADLSSFGRPMDCPADPFPLRPNGARLVFLGSNWRLKGLLDLLEAVRLVRSTVPNVHLVVGGPSDLASLSRLQETISEKGLEQSVLLAGRISRATLPAVLFHSDVFVLPTYAEALGMAILEAMAAGLAVVASSVGGIPEIIRTEHEGILVSPGDKVALAAALERVLLDHRLRGQLAAVGPIRASSFNVGLMIRGVKELYRHYARNVCCRPAPN
jgi:glycosyltransferase involved in cell wall biosynthesis